VNASKTIDELKARLASTPPTIEAALPVVREIANRAAVAATIEGMAPSVSVHSTAHQIVVEVRGRGARSTAAAINAAVSRTLPTIAGAVRAAALSGLGR
jgi:ribosomal protein S9